MFEGERPSGTKPQIYRELALMADGLFSGERDAIANAANLSALLWMGLADLNWAGFYFLRGPGLVLGPFQGKPACVRIEVGTGVCGTAAAQKKTVIVRGCRAFSRSHRLRRGLALGAGRASSQGAQSARRAGLDSPLPARFDQDDAEGIESLAALMGGGERSDLTNNSTSALRRLGSHRHGHRRRGLLGNPLAALLLRLFHRRCGLLGGALGLALGRGLFLGDFPWTSLRFLLAFCLAGHLAFPSVEFALSRR